MRVLRNGGCRRTSIPCSLSSTCLGISQTAPRVDLASALLMQCGLVFLQSAVRNRCSMHSSIHSGGRSLPAPQHGCSRTLRGPRCTKPAPQCRAAVQEQTRLSPLQLERQFRQQIAEPASCSVTASGGDATAQADGLQQGNSAVSSAAAAATVLRGDAPGNASPEADALTSGERDSTQPSVDELAAALAALPHSASSAAVLDGVWLDMQDICRCVAVLTGSGPLARAEDRQAHTTTEVRCIVAASKYAYVYLFDSIWRSIAWSCVPQSPHAAGKAAAAGPGARHIPVVRTEPAVQHWRLPAVHAGDFYPGAPQAPPHDRAAHL